MTYYLCNSVVGSIISYGYVVWWPEVSHKQAITELPTVQRIACPCVIGTIKGTPASRNENNVKLTPG